MKNLLEALARRITETQRRIARLEASQEHDWQNWTPTVTQGIAVNHDSGLAHYRIDGNTCRVWTRLVVTSTGTAGQVIAIGGQPATIYPAHVGNMLGIGTAGLTDSGTTNYVGMLSAQTATVWQIMVDQSANWLGASPSFGLEANDVITFEAEYEVA